jgi:AcrR family transcriptional regulator
MQARRTFTESARRAQIVAAAIDTIAEQGYARASFAQIAKRAGLSSTGLISYHFANKGELVEQVVQTIFTEIGEFMRGWLEEQSTARAALSSYIESSLEFATSRPAQMQALLDILLNGGLNYDKEAERDVVSPVARILRWGQDTGEFRDFDVHVMATSIQRSVEGPGFLLAGGDELDLEAYTRELVTIFDLATRKET